ncbi:hypothetical protein [Pantoea sp. App145]|uniref:hypothetical protein n=1 Tax=Pantoea sp. App145 TaxID=3071567 RepID=UPI003A81031B
MSERNKKNGNDGKDSSHSKMPGDNKTRTEAVMSPGRKKENDSQEGSYIRTSFHGCRAPHPDDEVNVPGHEDGVPAGGNDTPPDRGAPPLI